MSIYLTRVLKHIKQKFRELNTKVDKFIITVGKFNTLLSVKDKLIISKDIKELNNTIKQLYLINMYITLHLTTEKYAFFQGHMKYALRQTISWVIK